MCNGPVMKAHGRGSLYGVACDGYYFKEVGSVVGFEKCSSEVEGNKALRATLFNPLLVVNHEEYG